MRVAVLVLDGALDIGLTSGVLVRGDRADHDVCHWRSRLLLLQGASGLVGTLAPYFTHAGPKSHTIREVAGLTGWRGAQALKYQLGTASSVSL
jgi:hypothetical protein